MNLNVALVGCGAMAQYFYLPAMARKRREFGDIWLVDPNDRVLAAAAAMVDGKVARSLADVPGDIHMAIIAAPNKFHFPLAREAIERDAHLLIEKPIVILPEEGEALVALAGQRRIIAVNQTRRFAPYARTLRAQVQANAFGCLKSITHCEGEKLAWPFESGAAFHKTAKRTGVIMDIGVHVIDLYQYFFNPAWTLVSAQYDGFNGPEGLAEIKLKASGVPVSIRLSRYQKQSNVARLVFETAEVIINLEDLNAYTVQDRSGETRRVTATPTVLSYELLADDVLSDFLAVARGLSTPLCTAQSSLPVIAILDEIYRSATCYSGEIGTV